MNSIAFDRLDHVGAGVHDLDVAAAWWRDHFGFLREADFTIPETGARGAFLRRGDIRIELFEYPHQGMGRRKRKDLVEALREGGFHHVAFQIDDVAAAVAELERRGVDVAYPLSDGPFGAYAIVSDPSGNFVELFPKTDVRDPATPNGHRLAGVEERRPSIEG